MFGIGAAKADTVVPLVTPNTTITLTNATGKTVSGNATFNGTGSNGTGTETVPYSIPAFGEINVTNPVTVEPTLGYYPDAQIVPDVNPSTGAKYNDPIVHAFTCDNGNGHDSPTWNTADRQNTQPLAGTENYQEDILVVASGDQPCTFTVTAYGPNGEGPIYSQPIHFGANHARTGKLNDIMNHGLAPLYGVQVHFDGPSQANGRAALMHTDSASLDTRVTEMKQFTVSTDPTAVVRAYIEKWLPKNDWQFYLSNKEIRAMINGDGHGTRSYSLDLAQILVKSPANTNGTTVDQMKQWVIDQADGNLSNGELYHGFDPALWDNHNPANPALVFYDEPNAGLAEITLAETDIQTLYTLIKSDFLLQYVKNNPDQYGGSAGGLPDMNFSPTWSTQDPNQ